ESSLGRPGLAPDNGRDPAAVALRRAGPVALKAAVLTVALLLCACGTAAAPDTGASLPPLQARAVAAERGAASERRGPVRFPNPVVPAVGQAAPASHTPTTKDADPTTIDSGRPPDDMHQISIADAIAQHRPTLVIFASPAFCTSRICGPEVKVVQSLEPAYKDRLTFIHVEVYRDFAPDPSKRQLAPAVLEWRLQSEPWIFLIDARGIIQTRFEGPTATDEVQAAIVKLLG